MAKQLREDLVDSVPAPSLVPRWLRTTYEVLVLVGGFVFVGLFGLSVTLVSALLSRILPRRIGKPIGRWFIHAMFRGLTTYMSASGIVKLDLSDLDQLRDDGPLVLAPNHPSLLDAGFIAARLTNVVCVMKADVHRNPVLGGGARLAGYIDNATMPRMIRGAIAALREGQAVLMFPEGTRTVTPPVNPLKASFALVAREAGVPVQTILFETNSEFLCKGWPILRKPEFPIIYRARRGRRFEVGHDPRTTVAEIDAYFRRELGRI